MSHDLSHTQLAIVTFVSVYRGAHVAGPSFDEIARAIPISKTSIAYHVHKLLERGALRCEYIKGTRRLRNGTLHVPPEIAAALRTSESVSAA